MAYNFSLIFWPYLNLDLHIEDYETFHKLTNKQPKIMGSFENLDHFRTIQYTERLVFFFKNLFKNNF